ncbi:pyroglutamyl-peptidase I [Halobacillus litoralis]|uniref:pyroglutamyl-peptidase I n=1 Tax=Halobacillus litoralis TaxID=45668 RepID=UPI0013720D20|nr:pyroglutamyl-peptidase I [Halobacillus litoralis]MYL36392.1 pyroglutamyl-peptidase I [Halobacillus litoralis]
MKTLLLTGFEPFLDFPINPTNHIIEDLKGEEINGFHIEGRILSVDYNKSGYEILEYINDVEPDAVISLGLAAGRYKVTPERIAINCNESNEKDNEGNTPEGQPIQEEGPDGLFSTLPIKHFVERLQSKGYPAEVSNTAGTYLCNHVMYQALYHFHMNNQHIPSGFVHIPASHELAVQHGKLPSWSQSDLTDAVRNIIQELP